MFLATFYYTSFCSFFNIIFDISLSNYSVLFLCEFGVIFFFKVCYNFAGYR